MNRYKKFFSLSILIAFSFIIKDFINPTNRAIYYPQLIVGVVTAVWFMINCKKMRNYEYCFFFIVAIFFLQFYIHPATFRFSTIIYSFMFGCTFLGYARLLESRSISLKEFQVFLKCAIYIYTGVLFLQMIQSFAGMKVFNLMTDYSSKFKLNSLSWESSQLALIVPLCLYTYISAREVELGRPYKIKNDFISDTKIWVASMFATFLNGSMTAFLVFPIFLLKFVKMKNFVYIIVPVLLFLQILPYFTEYDIFNVSRLASFLKVMGSNDPRMLIDVDSSAATRIIPTWLYFHSFDLTSIGTWFGFGIDASRAVSTKLIIDRPDADIGAMSIFSLFYDYGTIAGVLWIYFVKLITTKKFFSFEMFVYFVVFNVLPINHHIVWLYLMFMFSLKYFRTRTL